MSSQHTKIAKNELHIWHANLAGLSKAPILENLHPDEIARANKMKFNEHKIKFLTCRVIFRNLASSYLEIHPNNIELHYTKYGKPFWKHDTDLNFNLSHSGHRAVFAFARNNHVGIDIEKIKTDFEVEDIVHNFFSKMECAALNKIPTELRHAAFFRCWTRKESFIKAVGEGLSFPLNSFTVSTKNLDAAMLLATHYNTKDVFNWSMGSFSECSNYIGAWSVKGSINTILNFNVDMNSISIEN